MSINKNMSMYNIITTEHPFNLKCAWGLWFFGVKIFVSLRGGDTPFRITRDYIYYGQVIIYDLLPETIFF